MSKADLKDLGLKIGPRNRLYNIISSFKVRNKYLGMWLTDQLSTAASLNEVKETVWRLRASLSVDMAPSLVNMSATFLKTGKFDTAYFLYSKARSLNKSLAMPQTLIALEVRNMRQRGRTHEVSLRYGEFLCLCLFFCR
jgi:hypothetical protein